MTQSRVNNPEIVVPSTANHLSATNIRNKSMDNNLEYHIKFPDNKNENYNQSIEELEKSPVPVALLLGWAGCQDRYLMKYSKIYENQG